MNFSMLLKPIIGSVIGYVTNYIAVKMLFRPLKPIKIGSYTLPFTPGMIPKEQPRLAKAIGEIVGARLITKEVLEYYCCIRKTTDARQLSCNDAL